MTMRTALHTAGGVEGALDGRLDSASEWALNGPGPLDVRVGVVYAPGAPMQVLGTAATSPWAVTVNPGHVVGSKGSTNGPYIAANDALATVALAVPPAANSRIDVIYAMQQDTAAVVSPDASTVAVLAAATGVAGAVPAVPAIPVGAVTLAQVTIASTAIAGTSGAGVTIAQVFLWTAPRGVPIPVRTQAERDAITAYAGLRDYRLDTGVIETYNGTAWSLASATVVAQITATLGPGFTTEATIVSSPAITGDGVKRFKVSVALGLTSTTVATDVFILRIRLDNAAGTVLREVYAQASSAAGISTLGTTVTTVPPVGSHTYWVI